MPRYFFHVYHDSPSRDEVGEELSDRHAAWKEATVIAGEALKDVDGALKPGHDWSLEVTDASEKVLFRLVVSAEEGARTPKGRSAAAVGQGLTQTDGQVMGGQSGKGAMKRG